MFSLRFSLFFFFFSTGKTQTVGERAAMKFGRYMWVIVLHWPGFIYVKLRGWARTTNKPIWNSPEEAAIKRILSRILNKKMLQNRKSFPKVKKSSSDQTWVESLFGGIIILCSGLRIQLRLQPHLTVCQSNSLGKYKLMRFWKRKVETVSSCRLLGMEFYNV